MVIFFKHVVLFFQARGESVDSVGDDPRTSKNILSPRVSVLFSQSLVSLWCACCFK